MEILLTEEFVKRYKLLPANIQKKAEKQEKLFRQNPFHPSLHTEKLEPKGRQIWSFRVDKLPSVVQVYRKSASSLSYSRPTRLDLQDSVLAEGEAARAKQLAKTN